MAKIQQATANNGKAITQKETFSRTTSVGNCIFADKSIIWKLLTDAAGYTRWNSTIISVNGNIALGETISLKAKMAPKRDFKLKIKEMAEGRLLVWGDGMGKRIFTLDDNGKGMVTFTMNEKIGGPLFPLFARYIPSFDAAFEQFAADLKKEAETIQNLEK